MTDFELLLKVGETAWLDFYNKKLNQAVLDQERFFNGLENYGPWALYEAIIVAANKRVSGDLLSYVLSIAHSKWVEELKKEMESDRYLRKLEAVKEDTKKAGQDLASRIKKARAGRIK